MTRLIGGAAGGRRLATPAGRGTRPTSDRVREGLFSSLESLQGGLVGAAFLDLYAGSGAVGLEAASRGASPVTLVEREQTAVRVIRENLAALDSGRIDSARINPAGINLVATPVERYLSGTPQAYDVVFLDPPYTEPADAALLALTSGGWLAPDGVVCVERATRDVAMGWPEGLIALRSRRYGDTTLWYGRAS